MIDPATIAPDTRPHECRAPQYILEGLAAINPEATLLYVGGGRWWLGMMMPDWKAADNGASRRATATKIMQIELSRGTHQQSYWRILRAQLLGAGFRYIHTFRGDPSGRIVEWFREAEYNYRHNLKERLNASEAITDGAVARQERAARADSDWRRYVAEAVRFAYRRPVSVIQGAARAIRRPFGRIIHK
jgi:hypothetical protein